MKKQVDIFFTALMFFTRLPVPKRIDHSPDLLQKSSRYFSWVGILVGLIAGVSYLACKQIFSPALSIFFSMILSILITGAFHEDGFADVCDAFGGGWTKEKILIIMKDSRLGTYGVTGLTSMLCFKFLLLFELSTELNGWLLAGIIISAHSLSRFAAITMLQQYQYVSDNETGKSKPLANSKLHPDEMVIALIGGFLPFVFVKYQFLGAITPVAFFRV
jgi:adenosylcobinamide-GDP ribazoletransferase